MAKGDTLKLTQVWLTSRMLPFISLGRGYFRLPLLVVSYTDSIFNWRLQD